MVVPEHFLTSELSRFIGFSKMVPIPLFHYPPGSPGYDQKLPPLPALQKPQPPFTRDQDTEPMESKHFSAVTEIIRTRPLLRLGTLHLGFANCVSQGQTTLRARFTSFSAYASLDFGDQRRGYDDSKAIPRARAGSALSEHLLETFRGSNGPRPSRVESVAERSHSAQYAAIRQVEKKEVNSENQANRPELPLNYHSELSNDVEALTSRSGDSLLFFHLHSQPRHCSRFLTMVNWLCCGKSAEKYFSDDGHQQPEVQAKQKSDVQALEKQERGLGPPSGREYVGHTAISFMEALSGASKFAPPPVPEIVGMATKLIKAFQAHAQQLMERIQGLLAVLVDTVAKELPEELEADVKKLERDLIFIAQQLTNIEEQSWALLAFLPGINDEKETLEDLSKGVKNVEAILQRTSHPLQSTMPRALPRPMDVFYGRDAIVAEAIKCLTLTPEPHWYALTGTGGIGKTSTAIAILHDGKIESHFGNLRFWISCVKAKSIEQLDSALHGGIVGGQDTSSPREAVIAKLQTLEQPALVVLDNFETPYAENQSDVEEILRVLNDLAQVSILMTIRAAVPPGDGIKWTHKPVGEVDAEAGKAIYWGILQVGEEKRTKSEQDDVAKLLDAVGFMPLAITLMARAAKKKHQGAKQLLAEYMKGGTSLLGPSGKDSQHNMDLCINISIDRLPLDRKDPSLKLLAIFAMLPAGAKRDSFWFPDQDFQPIELLLDTALLEWRGDLLYVHPVIRTFILQQPAFSEMVSTTLQEIVSVACEFLKRNEVSLGDSRFRECADAIKAEESNIQAVLLLPETVNKFPDLVYGLVILARHQSATSPRLEVAERALELADDSNLALRAEAFFCYSLNLHYQDHFERAMEQFQFAHDIFMSIPLPIRAADALLEKVIAFMYFTVGDFARKLQIIEQAQSEYMDASHAPGMARSAVVKGDVLWQRGDHSESLTVLKQASDLLLDSNQPHYLTRCYFTMSRTYFRLKDFDQGLKVGQDALKLYQEFSSDADVGDMFIVLGRGYLGSDQPGRAVAMLEEAIIKSTACGRLSVLTQAWREISLTWMKMGQMDDAKEGLERASVYCSLMPQGEHKRDEERCIRQYQGYLDDDQLLSQHEYRF
ncbi:hypothetical protein C8J56DRAFT_883144 [Mycena floridula]|nr:hypothetical protein C8J56DRAFT_883144 [Mycena floridula]